MHSWSYFYVVVIGILVFNPPRALAQSSVWQSLNDSGVAALDGKDTDKAFPLLKRALATAEATFGAMDVRTCQSHTFLGECYYMMGDYKNAEKHFRHSYSVLRKHSGTEYRFMSVYNCRLLAHTCVQLKRHNDSLPLFQWVLRMEESHGVMAESLGDDLNAYALALEELKRFDEERKGLERCLNFYSNANGASDKKTLTVKYQLARLSKLEKNFDKAESEITDLMREIDELQALRPEVAAYLYMYQSGYYFEQGRYSKAKELAQKALECYEASDNAPADEWNACFARLGDLEYAQNHYPAGDKHYISLLERQERAKPFDEMALVSSLEQLASSLLHQANATAAGPYIDRALGIRRRRQGASHHDVASALHLKAEWHALKGEDEQAEKLHQEAIRLREQALGEGNAAVEDSAFKLIDFYRAKGRNSSVDRLFQTTLQRREKAVGKESSELNRILSRYAGWHASQGKLDEAERLLKRAIVNAEQQHGLEGLAVAAALVQLADFYEYTSRYDEAELLYTRAVDIREKQLGPYDLNTAQAWRSLAWAKQRLAKAREALPFAQKAAKLCREYLDEDSGVLANVINVLAVCLEHTGDIESARREFKYALSLYERQNDLEGLATVCHNLAGVTDDSQEAIALYTKSLAIQNQTLSSQADFCERLLDLGNLSRGHRNLANLQLNLGNWAAAQDHFQQALEATEKGLGEEHELLIDALDSLAWFSQERGNLLEADALFARLLKLVEKRYGEKSSRTANVLQGIGSVRLEQGRFSDAEDAFREALAIRQEASDIHALGGLQGAGAAALYLGKRQDALAMFDQALQLYGDNIGPMDAATIQMWLARSHQLAGDLARAQSHIDEALSKLNAAEAIVHRQLPVRLVSCELHIEAGDFDSADKQLQEVIEAAETQIGKDCLIVGKALYLRSLVKREKRELAEAQQLNQSSRRVFEGLLGGENYLVATCNLQDIELVILNGDLPADAMERTRAANAVLAKAFGDHSPYIVSGLLTEATVLSKFQRSDEQRSILDRAAEILKQCECTSTLVNVRLLQQRAELESQAGNQSEADAVQRQAAEVLKSLNR